MAVQRKRNVCSSVRLIAGIDVLVHRTDLNKTKNLYHPILVKCSASSFIVKENIKQGNLVLETEHQSHGLTFVMFYFHYMIIVV